MMMRSLIKPLSQQKRHQNTTHHLPTAQSNRDNYYSKNTINIPPVPRIPTAKTACNKASLLTDSKSIRSINSKTPSKSTKKQHSTHRNKSPLKLHKVSLRKNPGNQASSVKKNKDQKLNPKSKHKLKKSKGKYLCQKIGNIESYESEDGNIECKPRQERRGRMSTLSSKKRGDETCRKEKVIEIEPLGMRTCSPIFCKVGESAEPYFKEIRGVGVPV